MEQLHTVRLPAGVMPQMVRSPGQGFQNSLPGSVRAGHGGNTVQQISPMHFAAEEERHHCIQHIVNNLVGYQGARDIYESARLLIAYALAKILLVQSSLWSAPGRPTRYHTGSRCCRRPDPSLSISMSVARSSSSSKKTGQPSFFVTPCRMSSR